MDKSTAAAEVSPPRAFTPKQMGDACEMLVAAELTLAGVPALKVPDNWPHYDIIAQPPGIAEPIRISVKARTFKKGAAFVTYKAGDQFDWLAIVLVSCPPRNPRRIYLIPRSIADSKARRDKPTSKTAADRYWRIDEIASRFHAYENNFSLSPGGEIGNTIGGARN